MSTVTHLHGHVTGAQEAIEHLTRVTHGHHSALCNLLLLQLPLRAQQPEQAHA